MPSPLLSFLLFIPFFFFFIAGASICAPPLAASNTSSSFPCPPFSAAAVLSFPFASAAGCGHPSFQVSCSSPNSIISINNLSFSVLRYDPISPSLFISPKSTSSHRPCSSLHIPNRPIDLSNSPFRISDSACSRISHLRSCSFSNHSNCSRECSFQCSLLRNPLQLLHGCTSSASGSSSFSEQGCQESVLEYLSTFLADSGIEIEWDDQDSYFSSCRACQSDNGVCGFNTSDPRKGFLCFRPKSRISPPWIHQYDRHRVAVLSAVFAVTCVAFAFAVFMIIFRWNRLRALAGGGSSEEDPTMVFLHRHRSASLLPPVFAYDELESSTNRFDPKRKIGDGGFGSVYLGQLDDGKLVAVKHLHRHHSAAASGRAFTTKSFCNEILILSSIDHPNLVKLHGYCSDSRGLLLVYDYVPNGTLAEHLHGSRSLYGKGKLTWAVRVEIALQTAMAIEYLHHSVQPPIVHRDITSANIFMEKDMRVKLGDFGLSRLLVFPETSSSSSSQCVWTGPQGTPGYLDPDYHRSFRLTEKSDVYSFGVVLLELISGMKAVDEKRERREAALADLVVPRIQMGLLRQVVDPVLLGRDGEVVDDRGGGGVGAAAELAFRCLAADKDDRPDAKEVVAELKRIGGRGGRGNGDCDG